MSSAAITPGVHATRMTWSVADVLSATGGHRMGVVPETTCFSTISIDSRQVGPGSLFIAVRGTNHDGHDFVRDALRSGALAAVVERTPEGCAGRALIGVTDTLRAL